MNEKYTITEAKRYLSNAHDALKKSGRVNGYYEDRKYVRMACGTAYSGVLIAIDEYLSSKDKTIIKKRHQRKSIEDYTSRLSNLNKKLLNHFDAAYHILHLDGYYDGVCERKLIDLGMKLAEEIISGVETHRF